MVWGSGKPKENFFILMTLPKLVFFLMKNYNSFEIINAGTGEDITIKDLAEKIKKMSDMKAK